MAQQKFRRRFHQDKPVPWNGRKRVKKRPQFRPETVPDGWAQAMAMRHTNRGAEDE